MSDAAAPPAELPALAAALAPAYRVERELGGGGMSRVYLATELALGRRVVVKVLPPELSAAMSADRFRREIQLAAQLQHPHIVPLLSAGEAGGLLYYTMPFVDGRSLRDRLAEAGRLPAAEAAAVLREVAGALAYAHRQGVVHRDVKPDNVLLSSGHALVTDFGIAKALSRAGDAPPGGPPGGPEAPNATALTSLGMSLGTPAYMAPEQGAGDPATDHRADLYAWGAVAFELLAGRPPFTARTAHQLLVAHMIEAPPELAALRPDLPPALAGVVMRCLAKKPDDRPQSGEEVVRALDGAAATGPHAAPAGVPEAAPRVAPSPAARRRWVAPAAVAGAVLAAAVGVASVRTRGRADEAGRPAGPGTGAAGAPAAGAPGALAADRVLVLPFDDATGDPALAPVARMAADWLTQGLAQTGVVKVVDAKTALVLVADARGGAGRPSTPQALARSAGAGTVVTGSVYKLGDSLQFQAQVVDGRTGDVLTALDAVRGPARNPLPAIDALRQRALSALAGRVDPRLGAFARVTGRPPLYPAYQAFVQGMERWTRTGNPQDGAADFRRATQLDPSYAQAWLFLANSLLNADRTGEADAIITRVDGMRDQLSPLERALLDIFLAGRRNDHPAGLAARRAAAAAAPGSEWSWVLVEGLAHAGRLREALDSLARVPADLPFLRGTPGRAVFEAELRHKLGDYGGALAAARAALPRFADDAQLRASEVRALGALGRGGEARPRLDALIALGADRRGDLAAVLHDVALDLAWHGQAALARVAGERELAMRQAYAADSGGVPRVQRRLAQAYYALGRYDEADRVMRPLAARDTSVATQGMYAIVAARRGDAATADRVARRLAAMTDAPYQGGGLLSWRASVAAVLGRRDEALALLRQLAASGFRLAWNLHGDPDFAAYQRDPGFAALIAPEP